MIKPHARRGNLLSIVTCEDEEARKRSASPPPGLNPNAVPYFDPTRPPPGFGRNSSSRLSPSRYFGDKVGWQLQLLNIYCNIQNQ